ncbi:unnamed protein product, partial [Ixodes pacificus]
MPSTGLWLYMRRSLTLRLQSVGRRPMSNWECSGILPPRQISY